MSQWVIRGLGTGIKTTPYPRKPDTSQGTTPGRPRGTSAAGAGAEELVALCPTGALVSDEGIKVDYRRCVHCYRCLRDSSQPIEWEHGYEWTAASNGQRSLPRSFKGSTHILVVDAGDCGACLNEVRQLNNPYYNMHRLGFFITPSPRHADVMLVVGPVTDHMRVALRKAYDAMPEPKRVIAVGACALSGGVFRESFACAAGVIDILPVDFEVPGHPPPPLAILHALLVATGRKLPVALVSTPAP